MPSIIDKELCPVAAIVVGYMPEIAALDALLLRLLADVQAVILLDNGGSHGYLSDLTGVRERIRYVDMGGNKGLGAALNHGMQEARAAGCRYVVTFDQDSAPPAGMVADLYKALLAKQCEGVRCAAVGPAFHDRREAGERCFPVYREVGGRIIITQPDPEAGMQEVDVLITSGMLVDSNVWESGVRYEEGLIVDYTDTDWCFRARAAGWRLFVLPSACMPHALSDTPPIRVPVVGVHLLRYSPTRRYYYFRNTVYFVQQPYVSWAWRRRLLAGLAVRLCSNVLIDEQRFKGFAMSLQGLWQGLRGRLGAHGS